MEKINKDLEEDNVFAEIKVYNTYLYLTAPKNKD